MTRLIDLDELLSRLGPMLEHWRRQATVGPPTWRDESASWPQPIVTDRATIDTPESVGFRLSRDPYNEVDVVVWTGGWADVSIAVNGGTVARCPEFADLDGAYSAIVRSVEEFLA